MSARVGFVRAGVSTGFRAPTPGQQNGFNISTIFDPALGDLVNNGTIPSNSPVAALRGGVPLSPETSVNYTAGVVFVAGMVMRLTVPVDRSAASIRRRNRPNTAFKFRGCFDMRNQHTPVS